MSKLVTTKKVTGVDVLDGLLAGKLYEVRGWTLLGFDEQKCFFEELSLFSNALMGAINAAIVKERHEQREGGR